MSFLGKTVNFSYRKKTDSNQLANNDANINPVCYKSKFVGLDFSVKNYVKDSTNILIIEPISRYMLKFMRSTSAVITGVLSGVIAAAILCFMLLQFGTIENTIMSSLILEKLESVFPNVDVSIKSAMLKWNSEYNTIEISMQKVRFNNICIPNVSIVPDYAKSFQQQKLMPRSVSINNPKIVVHVDEDYKKSIFDPDMESNSTKNKSMYEQVSEVVNFGCLFDNGTKCKISNASVVVHDNGIEWRVPSLYVEHTIGENIPKIIDMSVVLPKAKYSSNVVVVPTVCGNNVSYNVKLASLNPAILREALIKRSGMIGQKLISMLDGYHIPISGDLTLNCTNDTLTNGDFDLIGANGVIKLPIRNSISIDTCKKVDNCSIVGTFTPSKADIKTLNAVYGNAMLQITGVSIPLYKFKFMDVVNVDGTLSISNMDISEIENILPESVVRRTISALKGYIPSFQIELFKVDLKGPITFAGKICSDTIQAKESIFKVNNAQIPLGQHFLTNITASGTMTNDTMDVKIAKATFGKASINHGVLSMLNSDKTWSGKININIPVRDITNYAGKISKKLSGLPFESLHIKADAIFDLSIASVKNDNKQFADLPFNIISGDGFLRSSDNTKDLKLSWDEKGMRVVGDIAHEDNRVEIDLTEDFKKHSGYSTIQFKSSTEFLDKSIPCIAQICDGFVSLVVKNSWNKSSEIYNVNADLNESAINLPCIGHVKNKSEEGTLTASVTKQNEKLNFSDIQIRTKKSQISGTLKSDLYGNIEQCSFDHMILQGASSKFNVQKNSDGKYVASAVGNTIDFTKAYAMLSAINKNTEVLLYLNLNQAVLLNDAIMKNVKASFVLRSGKIMSGSGVGIIGEKTSIAVNAKELPVGSDGEHSSLVYVSTADAGELLRYINASHTVIGGTLSLVIKSSEKSNGSTSGTCTINDFLIASNDTLKKFISLTSQHITQISKDSTIGFNFASCDFTIANGKIMAIENGRAISPIMSLSFNGEYDIPNLFIKLCGCVSPMSSLTSADSDALVSDYEINGAKDDLQISVAPFYSVDKSEAKMRYGSYSDEPHHANVIQLSPVKITPDPKATDPYHSASFDVEVHGIPSNNAAKTASKKTTMSNGVKIIRGSGK